MCSFHSNRTVQLPFKVRVDAIKPAFLKEVHGDPFPPDNAFDLLFPSSARFSSEWLEQLEGRLARLEATLGQSTFGQLSQQIASIASDIHRIAMKYAPATKGEIVGSRYIADRLGCTTQWIGELVRQGRIPSVCIVPGTGNGKLWKFFKSKIDDWIESR